jgi:hypothetical protein
VASGNASIGETTARQGEKLFGGLKKNRLFMASCHSLYALYVEARGAV